MRALNVWVNEVIRRVRYNNDGAARLRTISSIRVRSRAALRIIISLLTNSTISNEDCEIVLILRRNMITILRLSEDGQDLARYMIRRIISALNEDYRRTTVCYRINDGLRTLISMDLRINACVRLIVINVLCRAILIIMIRDREVNGLITATLSTRIVIIRRSILTRRNARPVEINVVVQIEAVLRFLRNFLAMELIRAIISMYFIRRNYVIM